MSVAQIMQRLSALPDKHVVLTGGEPMLYSSVTELARQIRLEGYHLTIETAGTVWQEMDCDLWSISPKLQASAPPTATPGNWHRLHQQRRHRPDVVQRMMAGSYQLKFVVNSPEDAQEILAYLAQLPSYDRQRVLMMPQGTDTVTLDRQAQWLVPWCEQNGLTFCPRQHIYWFGNRRGT